MRYGRTKLQSVDSPKKRLRFGFSGKNKRGGVSEGTQRVTPDDILDSLTRQAASQVGFGSQQEEGFDLLNEPEEQRQGSEPTLSTGGQLRLPSNRSVGRIGIIVMCLGGFLIIWLYSSGRSVFNGSQLNTLVQKTGVQSIFSNLPQVAIMSIFAMTIALWIAVRRRASRIQIPT